MEIRRSITEELAKLALQLLPKRVETHGYRLDTRQPERGYSRDTYNRTMKK